MYVLNSLCVLKKVIMFVPEFCAVLGLGGRKCKSVNGCQRARLGVCTEVAMHLWQWLWW